MINITFDLETLGNQTTAPIVQIAAVAFDMQGKELDSCNFKADMRTIPENQFSVDYDTLRWWMHQIANNKGLIGVMEGSLSHDTMLTSFMRWIADVSEEHDSEIQYWSHATFDPPILDRHCKIYNLPRLPFRQQRDIRTLTAIAGYIEVKRKGNHHDALDDCRYQAQYITKGLNYIREGKHGL